MTSKPPYLLMVMTDGRRDYIERTIPSAMENLSYPPTKFYIFNDTGLDTFEGKAYHAWLQERFSGVNVISRLRRMGFGGAIQFAWRILADNPTTEQQLPKWVFHLEDDFVFNRPVPVEDMIAVLDRHPHIAQMALRRQPWNDAERAAGGVIEQHPRDFEQWSDFAGRTWLEHRRWFTTNPCVYRRSLMQLGWPNIPNSEGIFSHRLFQDSTVRTAYWGAPEEPPWVEHIGEVRLGEQYW